MHCLLCDDVVSALPSWFSFFIEQDKRAVCTYCEQKFSYIIGDICADCGRSFQCLADEYKKGEYCQDCLRWRQDPYFQHVYVKNRSVYVYNDWMKEVLARFKFRGDAALVQIFASAFANTFRQYFPHCNCIVPIPLSLPRQYERGFNQAELLAACLSIPVMKTSLMRSDAEKQSKKTRAERLRRSRSFYFAAEESFHGKNIVLIDDVYTTGITVRQAAQCFYERGAKNVSSLTLCR
ncbi:ComF family protein [Bacillus cereus group sp. BfR-BA-01380]|uniref:ComF family protein n=1 Tax=Bacillus cereus group sp. BfR-BA-01380 TaxID=2920324 RepID=UPI001F5A1B0B|nr:ComF family protein [Bacillus cereus group sp. BfR-BA-01380]